MQQVKDLSVPVCWRIKESNLNWLRSAAQEQERPVTWLINKLVEQAKKDREGSNAKQP